MASSFRGHFPGDPLNLTVCQRGAWQDRLLPLSGLLHLTCPRRRPAAHRRGCASLFAATECGFDFFEGRKIFLEPIHMLLHLDDGRPEFLHRAQGSSHPGHLCLGRPLTDRPTHEPEHEHPTQQTDEHPPPYGILLHTVLLPVAAVPVVSHDRCHGSLALATPAYGGVKAPLCNPVLLVSALGGSLCRMAARVNNKTVASVVRNIAS